MDVRANFDEKVDNEKLIKYAKAYKADISNDLEVVLKTAFTDVRNLPVLGYTAKYTEDFSQPVTLKEYVEKFIDKYQRGYDGRPSVRVGNSSKTFSDPSVGLVLSLRVKNIPEKDLIKIIEGHSLQMSIENIIGDLLEEYLSVKLKNSGWFCCWGSSIDAVDFCNAKGELLQIKNSDNSENSSSSRVRNGTEIKKWARRKSTQENTFFWDKLKELTGVKDISEGDFRAFIKYTIGKNPDCIHVSDESIYL